MEATEKLPRIKSESGILVVKPDSGRVAPDREKAAVFPLAAFQLTFQKREWSREGDTMPTATEDLFLATRKMCEDFKTKQWTLRTGSYSEAYIQTKGARPKDRREEILKRFNQFVESLCALVVDAVTDLVGIAARMPDTTLKNRIEFLESHVKDCIIKPNIQKAAVVRWLYEACGVDRSIESLENLDHWVAPGWLTEDLCRSRIEQRVGVLAGVRTKMLVDQCHTIAFGRTSDALKDAVAKNVASLLPDGTGVGRVGSDDAQVGIGSASVSPLLDVSADGACVNWKGGVFLCTKRQAIVMLLLYSAWKKNQPAVWKMTLLGAAESETSDMKSIFKDSPLWQTLVVSGEKKGTYLLRPEDDLPANTPQIPR
ncbi:MAG: hypothetical protein LAP21_26100 [Acidobacteriia bacterium]|nr:hypothetical protein [Terriglobia bacterium]